jgi:hypothetical protein
MSNTQDWVDAVSQELAIATPVDVATLLDLARIAAHQVERPAAPLTTYLLGYAVGQGMDPAVAMGKITDLAANWSPVGAVAE